MMSSERIVKITVLALLVVLCLGLLYYFHGILGTGILISHLFYIPVIIATLWYRKKGLLVALILAGGLILFPRTENIPLIQDATRASGLLLVGLLVHFALEGKETLYKGLEEANTLLENRLNEMKKIKKVNYEKTKEKEKFAKEEELKRYMIINKAGIIKTSSELLLKSCDSSELKEELERIKRNSSRIIEVLDVENK